MLLQAMRLEEISKGVSICLLTLNLCLHHILNLGCFLPGLTEPGVLGSAFLSPLSLPSPRGKCGQMPQLRGSLSVILPLNFYPRGVGITVCEL